MARISPFVAWCGGTAVSATIAWFGVAGAVSSAEQAGPPIAVPEVAAARTTAPRTAVATPAPTTPAAPATPAVTLTSGTGGVTPAPASRRPTSRTRTTAAAPSRTAAAPRPSTGRPSGTAPLVTRTVSGGSAVLSLDPKGVTLVSASPAPGHTGRAVKETYRSSEGETGTLTITFDGAEGTSWIRATWDGTATEVTTSAG